MNRELIIVIDQLGREKGIDKEVLFEALESALLSASRKSLGPGDNIRIHIDRKTGEFRVYHRKKVVEAVTDPELEISLADAKALTAEAELDVELELLQDKPLQDLGRIAAQTAKQVILQKVRDAEREGDLLGVRRQGRADPPRRGPPHREAQRDPRDRQGRGDPARPRADSRASATTRATASAPSCSRCGAAPRDRRSRCRARIRATSRVSSRRRSPRSRKASWW